MVLSSQAIMHSSCQLHLIFCLPGQTILEFESSEYKPAPLTPCSHQDFLPWDSFKQIPEGKKYFSEMWELWSFLGVWLLPCLLLHYPDVTAARPSDLHVLNQFCLGKYDFQQCILPHWYLDHLCQEVIINIFYKSPRLPVPCYVIPLEDVGMAQDPQKGMRVWSVAWKNWKKALFVSFWSGSL